MNATLPFISIIIPTRPGQSEVPSLPAAKALQYPADRLEFIVARGRQPAVQRNHAVRSARGEFIYFLDDDALPLTDNLQRALQHFQQPSVQLVGGPSLCPPTAPRLEQIFAAVLASRLAFASSRARYDSVGVVRPSSEKELILCNLIVRKEEFLACGGFDEALYPNEENALMDAMQKRGGILLYDPQFIAYRRPRPTARAFLKMVFTYGRGRAEQFRLHPTWGSFPNFVPPLFILYLLSLPWMPMWGWFPLAAYTLLLKIQGAASAIQFGFVNGVLAVPWVVLTHLGYGAGFWRGLLTSLQKKPGTPGTTVTLESF